MKHFRRGTEEESAVKKHGPTTICQVLPAVELHFLCSYFLVVFCSVCGLNLRLYHILPCIQV